MFQYFFHDSASGAAWIGALISILGFVAVLVSLRIARNAYLLTVPPSVDIEYRDSKMVITNASPFDVVDVSVYVTLYTFGGLSEHSGIKGRYCGNTAFAKCPKIKPKGTFSVDDKTLGFMSDTVHDENTNRMSAFTVVFRRSVDGKKFVVIEPFSCFRIEGTGTLAVLALHQSSSGGQNASGLLEIYRSIVAAEKFYYGGDE